MNIIIIRIDIALLPMMSSDCFTEMIKRLNHPQPCTLFAYNRHAHVYNKVNIDARYANACMVTVKFYKRCAL